MISGTHIVLYSRDAAADRAFLGDVLGFPSIDAGGGWLIFALPPAELGIHPAGENNRHELHFTWENIKAEIAALAKKGVHCSSLHEGRMGLAYHGFASRRRRSRSEPAEASGGSNRKSTNELITFAVAHDPCEPASAKRQRPPEGGR